MASSSTAWALERYTSFGDLLRYLRRRAGLTQRELSIAVGYSEAQISRLELNQRLPDPAVVTARFLPALGAQAEPELADQLLRLAAETRAWEAGAPGQPPFKGLLPFEEADAALFFGRAADTRRLIDQIDALVAVGRGQRLLGLVGASGCGKSSLVRAGLLPALRGRPASARWPLHLIAPTAQPLPALADALGLTAGADPAGWPAALAEALAAQAHRAGAAVSLLVVDQFEELFSLGTPADAQAAYVAGLLAAAAGPAVVLISLRADYYSQCARFPRLAEALAQHQIYLGPLTMPELRQAIEAPAAGGGWELEPGLVDLILRDGGGTDADSLQPGALPLLSHALLETWERRRGRQLTLRAYLEAGGVQGALAQTAEMVLHDRLDHGQRQIARRLFLGLTQPAEAGGEVRRRAPLAELFAQGESEAAVHAVLTVLADARLIVMDDTSAQIAHETLLHAWPTLRAWLEESRDLRRWHHQVTAAAQEWEALGREPGLLYRGARLNAALEWAELGSAAEPLGAAAQAFLAASRAQAEAESAEREARRRAEFEAAQQLAASERARADEHARAAGQLRRLVAALTAALALALALGGLALYLDRRNLAQAASAQAMLRLTYAREVAETALVQAAADPELGLLLAWQAVSATYPADGVVVPEARAALAQTLGQTAARQVPALAETSRPAGLAASGTQLALCGPDDVWRVWAVASATAVFTLPVQAPEIRALAFAAEGTRLTALAAGPGGGLEAVTWALPAGQVVTTASYSSADLAALSADGRRLALWSAGRRQFTLWELGAAEPAATLTWLGDPPSVLALAPDGGRLAAGWPDGSLRIWETSTAAVRPLSSGAAGPVQLLAFAPDGRHLAAALPDGGLQVWDPAAGQLSLALPGPGRPLRALTFSADSAQLYTADAAGAVRAFPLEIETALAAFHTRGLRALTLAECQRYLHRAECPPP